MPSSSRFEDLLPAREVEHVVDAEGLGWRGGRQGGEAAGTAAAKPVAVVGYAHLATRGSGEVGADPSGQPEARVGAGRSAQFSVPSAASTQYKYRPRSVDKKLSAILILDSQPGVALQRPKSLSEPATLLRLST